MTSIVRTATMAVVLCAVALGVQGCLPLPQTPGPQSSEPTSSEPASSEAPQDDAEIAAEIYLTFACSYNGQVEDMSTAIHGDDLETVNALSMTGLDITQSAIEAFGTRAWQEPLATPIADLVTGLEALVVPLQAGVDAQSSADIDQMDFTLANELTAPAGVAFREVVGLPSDPAEACGLEPLETTEP